MKGPSKLIFTDELIQWGSESCAPGHEYGGVRDYYLLHVITKGRGVFQTAGKKWNLTKGDAFLIFPGQKHQYQADENTPWIYFWLGFTGELSPLLNSLRISGGSPVLHSDDPDALVRLFSEIPPRRMVRHPAVVLENLGRLNTILGRLFKERVAVEEGIHEKGPAASHHVHSMEMFILTYFKTPIQVQDIIDFVQLERSYASRIFKEQTGMSIGHTLRQHRFRYAEECLKEGFSAKETAYSCGFRDYNNFLKAFRKAYGMTPGEFKT